MDHLKPMEKETICSHGAIFFRHHFFPFSADRNFLPLVAEHRGEDPGSYGGAARRGGVLPPLVSRNERCYAEEKKKPRGGGGGDARALTPPPTRSLRSLKREKDVETLSQPQNSTGGGGRKLESCQEIWMDMKGDWRERGRDGGRGRTDACNAATTEGTAQKVWLAVKKGDSNNLSVSSVSVCVTAIGMERERV